MGNQNTTDSKQTPITTNSNKIILKLRYRDIILHYSYKFKVNIGDIDIFPNGFDGLRLWDTDVILSRFIILQNQRFQNKSVCVFKAGVGLSGIALSKWSTCKAITMVDFRQEVVRNMKVNCERNQVKNVNSVLIDLNQFDNFSKTYDVVVSANLFGEGFSGQNVLNIWRKLLNVGGQAYLLIPDRKSDVKKFVQFVDKTEFQINNLILTAEEYQASPLFNKIEGQTQFPKIGKSDFYVIGLTKLREGTIVQKPLPKGHGLKEKKQKVGQNGNIPQKVQKQEQKTPAKVVQHKIVEKQVKKEEKVVIETKIEEKEEQKPKQSPIEEVQKEQVIEEKKEEQKQQEKHQEEEKQTTVEVKEEEDKISEQKNQAQEEEPIKEVEKCENVEQQRSSQVEDEKCEQKEKEVEPESTQKQEEKTQKQIEKQQQPKQEELVSEQKKQNLASEEIPEKQSDKERKLSEEQQVVKDESKQQHDVELPLTHEPVKDQVQQEKEQKEEEKPEPEPKPQPEQADNKEITETVEVEKKEKKKKKAKKKKIERRPSGGQDPNEPKQQ